MDGTVIMQLVTSLGASGVLAWYCWYVTSTTLPKLVGEFREETKLIRDVAMTERSHMAEQTERLATAMQQTVRDEAAAERAHHAEQTARIAGVMEQMLEKCRVTK